MLNENFSLNIKSLSDYEYKIIDMGNKEYLMAKTDSEYELHVHNKSNFPCNVSISIGDTAAGSWNMAGRTTLKLVRDLKTSRSLVFDKRFWHVKNNLPSYQGRVKSSIITIFTPLIPGFHNIVTLSIPILLCDHDV